MSGVNSLLKYRYQKKTSAAEASCPSSPISISSSISSVQEIGTPQLSTPNASPTFPSKFSKNVAHNSSTTSKPSVPHSSDTATVASNSPWLSKNQVLGRTRIQAVSTSDNSRSTLNEDDSDSNDSLSLDQREILAKVNSLMEVFPDMTRERLEEAVKQANGDVETATSFIIKLKTSEENINQRKRKYAIFQPSSVQSCSDSSPLAPQAKRSRILSSSDESCDTNSGPAAVASGVSGGGKTAPPTNGSNIIVNVENGQPDACVIYERIKFLQEAFPNLSRQELKRVLTVSNYNIDLATTTLTSYQSSEPILATKSASSMKTILANRAHVKTTTGTVDGTGDEAATSTVVSVDGASVQVTGKKRQRVYIESDSDSEVKYDEERTKDVTKSANQLVLDFFNSATTEELIIMNGCSRRKADLVVGLRPFSDWNDLVSKVDNCQSLPDHLIGEGHEIIRLRSTVTDLMERCQNISSKLETFVADLTSRTSIDANDAEHNYVAVQPACLSPSMSLKPYQMVGLNWLLMMNAHDLNGILGDEMGLGKTIQTISFLAQLHAEGNRQPHIIVAPSSTIDNWLRELELWCPALKVLLYYGSQEARRAIRNDVLDGVEEEFHVLLTTYNMATGNIDDRVMFKKIKFYYAIFDEGHMLKNMDSIRYKCLTKIQAKRRLLLTGTPLQNNLLELMSLLVFLMPHLFVGKTDILKRIFSTFSSRPATGEIRGTYEKETLAQTKHILKPFFLRRLKTEVLEQLPIKTMTVSYVKLSFEQQDLYDELLGNYAREIDNKNSDLDGAVKGNQGTAMMMQLRKAANHHLLHRRQFNDTRLRQMAKLMLEEPTHREANVEFVFEDMQVMSDFELHTLCNQYEVLKPFRLDQEMITDSGKFRHLDEVLPTMKTRGDRVLLFSQFTMMLDIVEVYMKARKHKYLRLDGQTPVVERQELIDEFSTDNSIFIFLLSTKAGGLGINLTAANVVIIHDIDFNPYNDKQAEDRCHRLGQSREVNIYRLISSNTIEEAILRCAEAKLKLEIDVTGTGDKDAEDMESNDVASLLKEALQMRSNS